MSEEVAVASPWESDKVLGVLAKFPAPVGDLVRAFPGRQAADEHPKWLDPWFSGLIAAEVEGKAVALPKLVSSTAEGLDLSPLHRTPVSKTVRILSVRPEYFRGFRHLDCPVNLDADLVVVEGRNSTGKTGLAEALEWLLTGSLSRRVSGQYGSARELANCLSNEFRPAKEPTFVEATLLENGRRRLLRRVLTRDYSTTATSGTTSELYLDDVLLPTAEQGALFEELFASTHPILMQHTLRQFVHDTPSNRRQYFERLLQIDELTALIERAVVGDSRLREFQPPGHEKVVALWRDLGSALHDESLRKKAQDVLGAKVRDRGRRFDALLVEIGTRELGIATHERSLPAIRQSVRAHLVRKRDEQLPFLSVSRPDPRAHDFQASDVLSAATAKVLEAGHRLKTALAAADTVSASQLAIAKAYEDLARAGLIAHQPVESQPCPLCASGQPTLTLARIATIEGWRPAAEAVSAARQGLEKAVFSAEQAANAAEQALRRVLPGIGAEGSASDIPGVPESARDAASRALTATRFLWEQRSRMAGLLRAYVTALPEDAPPSEALVGFAEQIRLSEPDLLVAMQRHGEAFETLDGLVGGQSRQDPLYRLSETWLAIADDPSALVAACRWDDAASRAQASLLSIRTSLIAFRAEIVKEAQRAFSQDMTQVWNRLRQDTSTRFESITIPEPRGKGYKLEVELKATIEGAAGSKEVDALRVFSESQINAVGIAAYVSRARRLGHKILVFDDPVQSMDDEHLRSFAGPMLDDLLDEGFQVLILTHNEQFYRTIADHHYAREPYATLSTRASRRHGCCVDEGSRRVAERLKRADRLAEDGQLQEAWRFVRLALERLYTVLRTKHDSSFAPESWRNQTAEAMWNDGVATIVTTHLPDAASRLKEILALAVAGAHDKAPTGETDLKSSTAYVRALLSKFRVAG